MSSYTGTLLIQRVRDITRYHEARRVDDQIQQARETLEKLLALLQSAPVERDRFLAHVYQSPEEVSSNVTYDFFRFVGEAKTMKSRLLVLYPIFSPQRDIEHLTQNLPLRYRPRVFPPTSGFGIRVRLPVR